MLSFIKSFFGREPREPITLPQLLRKSFPHPFIREPDPIKEYPGWYRHDGGHRQVTEDTLVGTHCGTYASLDGTGLMFAKAGSFKWHNDHITHLRDEFQSFCVFDHLPEENQAKIKAAWERRRQKLNEK